MKLNVIERITLIGELPASGNFATLKIVRKLKDSLSFSEEEHKALCFRYLYKCGECGNEVYAPEAVMCAGCSVYMESTDTMAWSQEGDIEKEIHMGDKAKEIIVALLEKKQEEDPDNTIDVHLSLYEKIKEVEDGKAD